MKISSHILPILIILSSITFSYWRLSNTFFQQDEWQTIAGNIYYQSKGISGIIGSFSPPDPIAHFTPLARVFSWVQYPVFYTNFSLHAWLSIILHSVNACLLYYLVFFFVKNRRIATIAGLIFATNAISDQVVTWIISTDGYEMTTLFLLLSVLFFSRFLTMKDYGKKNLTVSLILLLVSLLFHETGIFLLVFYPLYLLFYRRSNRKKLLTPLLLGICILLIIFVSLRIPFFFGITNPLPAVTDISHPPVAVYPYRLLSIAVKSYAQTFVSQNILITISNIVVRLGYPQFVGFDNDVNPYISQTIVLDYVSYIISVFVIGVVLLLVRKFRSVVKEKNLLPLYLWSMLFIPTSLLPYAFVSGKAGYASLLEPRFFYAAAIGSSVLIATITYTFLLRFSNAKIKTFFVYFFLGLYLSIHIYAVKSDVVRLEKIGTPIKSSLSSTISSYPKLPRTVIFYTESDTAYYGMPDNEKTLPVEIGFGKMLMVWYQSSERFPGCLYENQFLLDILSEGYRNCDGRGFGYFRKYDTLIAAIKKNNVATEDIIAYSWNGNTEEFKDITTQIRNKINSQYANR